jgi:phage N-6-adenine-methyltransferase
MKGAALNRHESKQDYETPPEFLAAVARRFGSIAFDLAARADNAKAEHFFTPDQDALVQDWTRLRGVCFLNPEFGDIEPWVRKCRWSASQDCDRTILALVPASVGAEWWTKHVHGHAYALALAPRLKFVGADDAYPKDLALLVYGGGHGPGFWPWRWR